MKLGDCMFSSDNQSASFYQQAEECLNRITRTHKIAEKIKWNFQLAEILKNSARQELITDVLLHYMNVVIEAVHLLQVHKTNKNTEEIFHYINQALLELMQINNTNQSALINFHVYAILKQFNHALIDLNQFSLNIPMLDPSHENAKAFASLQINLQETLIRLFKAKLSKENKGIVKSLKERLLLIKITEEAIINEPEKPTEIIVASASLPLIEPLTKTPTAESVLVNSPRLFKPKYCQIGAVIAFSWMLATNGYVLPSLLASLLGGAAGFAFDALIEPHHSQKNKSLKPRH